MKKLLTFTIVLFLAIACHKENLYDYSRAEYFNGGTMIEGIGDMTSGDLYNTIVENPFTETSQEPISTFSIDADGGSYSNVRRFLTEGMLPPADAIRTEELINYFNLDYPSDNTPHPLAINGEVTTCPWQEGHKLIRVGIKGSSLPADQLPPNNYVFLIDVSGSMSSDDKLDLLKEGFLMLLEELTDKDKIAIVTYAGSAGVVLPSTSGDKKDKIRKAIESLGAGGSTAGAEGIITAYSIAWDNFIPGGNNRVILGSDGDFNVGPRSQEELIALVEEKRDLGIFLTVLGVGRGNLNDGMMEQVANHGNGTYEYLDNSDQAKKVFIYERNKFFTIAKDVKVQVNFNPSVVKAYRLIGYENRLLATQDFEDDKKDAGEIGMGQNITALYEIKMAETAPALRSDPVFTIDFRYKEPSKDTSVPLQLSIYDEGKSFLQSSQHTRFTASVAGFVLLLRNSEYKGTLTYQNISEWAAQASSYDPHGWKAEFLKLVDIAAGM